MEENVFDDKSLVPDGTSVLKALGETGNLWLELRREVQEDYGPAIEEWKYYGPKSGWTMRFVSTRGNLFFFNVIRGGFSLSFVLGEKAAAAALRSDLPKSIIDAIKGATEHAGGRGIRLEVKDKEMAEVVRKLLKIKMEN